MSGCTKQGRAHLARAGLCPPGQPTGPHRTEPRAHADALGGLMAERIGHTTEAAPTFGRAIAGSRARVEGRRLGIRVARRTGLREGASIRLVSATTIASLLGV